MGSTWRKYPDQIELVLKESPSFIFRSSSLTNRLPFIVFRYCTFANLFNFRLSLMWYIYMGGGTGWRETGRKGGGRCTGGGRRGGGKWDSQGGGKREKKGKITQHCAIFRNRKIAKRREPKNTGREQGLKGTGSGRFKPPVPHSLSLSIYIYIPSTIYPEEHPKIHQQKVLRNIVG